MTRTQLEQQMRAMPDMARVDDEMLTMLITKEMNTDGEESMKLQQIMSVLLTAAKSRGMTLHALKDKGAGKKRKTFQANMYELLKVATSDRPVTSKIIICIGKVNDLL